jgi:WD40 repeat protein
VERSEYQYSRPHSKVGQVVFHPTASHVLASASGDHLIRLWDIENGQDASITLKGHGDSIQSLCWNTVGTTLATVSTVFRAPVEASC